MSKKLFALYLMLLTVGVTVAQNYNGPESIVYDSIGERYFISNVNGNTILQLDAENKLTDFVTSGLNGPKGLLIIGDTLIAANHTSIQGFLLSDASRVINIVVDGSEFMNDVTSDGKGNLYVTDMNKHRVYRVSLNTASYTIFNSDVRNPNGILYNAENNNLIICSWGANAKIQSLSITDSVLTNLVITKLSDLDGLAQDNCGYIYVSSWGKNAVYAFEPTFQKPPTKISEGHNGPADISIRQDNQMLLVPNLNTNKIDFIELGMDCFDTVYYKNPANNSVDLDTLVTIEWEEVAGASGYQIEYGTDSMFYKTVGFKITSNLSTDLEELKKGTTYYWRVASICDNKKIFYSDSWSFTTVASTVSIADNGTKNKTDMYPNPFINTIFFNEPVNSVSVFSLSGQLLYNQPNSVTNLELTQLAKGAYIIEYKNESGKKLNQVLIKK